MRTPHCQAIIAQVEMRTPHCQVRGFLMFYQAFLKISLVSIIASTCFISSIAHGFDADHQPFYTHMAKHIEDSFAEYSHHLMEQYQKASLVRSQNRDNPLLLQIKEIQREYEKELSQRAENIKNLKNSLNQRIAIFNQTPIQE